ncbi:hypothetical protein ON010_g8792 [Phytophthora cinnamomi]|nr:hypothetical protein ON010_g8792 [Phytophthora cinnamomi]
MYFLYMQTQISVEYTRIASSGVNLVRRAAYLSYIQQDNVRSAISSHPTPTAGSVLKRDNPEGWLSASLIFHFPSASSTMNFVVIIYVILNVLVTATASAPALAFGDIADISTPAPNVTPSKHYTPQTTKRSSTIDTITTSTPANSSSGSSSASGSAASSVIRDFLAGSRTTAISTIESTYQNWVGPVTQKSRDTACYREAHFGKTCPLEFNHKLGTCWAQCPLAYPVKCGMECIRQNDDCTLEVRGAPEVAYTSEETPMDSYLNIHAQLQRRRELAKAKRAAGPRVLVCGPVDSGKSTLSQILVNYALRLGEKPTLVELDVGHGCLSVPGTLAASPLDMNSLSIDEDFVLTNPLALFYGHAAASENVELFRYQQQQLARAVKRRLANDEEVNASGCVVNTCGWVDGMGFDLLVQAIRDFDVDVVLVIGQDRLYSRLQSTLTGANANGVDRSIVKLARSGGVVPLNSKLRSAARISCIREYFYGAHSLSVAIPTLSPCINEFSFEDVSFYTIKDMKVSDVMLPVGQVETQTDRLRVVPVEKTADLGHSLAAVAHPRHGQDASSLSSADLSWLLGAPAAGFVFMYVSALWLQIELIANTICFFVVHIAARCPRETCWWDRSSGWNNFETKNPNKVSF